jgi:hypothetical protein
LVKKEPIPAELDFFATYSRLVGLFEVSWNGLAKPSYSHEQVSEVGATLIREMKALAEKRGARFAVVDLLYPGAWESREVLRLLRPYGIDWFECARNETEQDSIPVLGHPNGRMNAAWADCIQRELETRAWVGSRVLAQ